MRKIKILYKEHKEAINYIVFGALTTLVSLVSYYVCVSVFFDPQKPAQLQAANFISWIISVSFAYYTNRKFVFESNSSNVIAEYLKFVSSRVTTLIIDMVLMFMFVTVIGLNDKLIKVIVQIIVIIGNYILSKWFVFKNNSL